jgi:hypothetical protein
MTQTYRKPDPMATWMLQELRQRKALYGSAWVCTIVDGQGRAAAYLGTGHTATNPLTAHFFRDKGRAERFAADNPPALGAPSPHVLIRIETVAEACDREIAGIEGSQP